MQKKNRVIEYKKINSKPKKKVKKKLREVNEYNNYLKDENINYQDKVKKIIKKSKKKVSKRVYFFRKFVIFGSVLIIILILLYYLLFKSRYFMLLKVNVNNNNISNYDDIISSSNIKMYDNTFKNIYYIKNNIKNIKLKSPYIKDINIKLSGKHTLLLDIVEREKYYFVYDKEFNRYFILDKEGCILEEKNSINDKNDEFYVSGITFDKDVILSDYINENDINKLNTFENIKTKFKEKFIDFNITKLILKKGKFYIYLNDKIEVILNGDDNLDYNLNLLKNIFENINDIPGTVDMTKDNPTFVRFE